jgi:hypothetical protein
MFIVAGIAQFISSLSYYIGVKTGVIGELFCLYIQAVALHKEIESVD